MGYVELENLNSAKEERPLTRRDLYEFGEILARNLKGDIRSELVGDFGTSLRRDIKKDMEIAINDAVDGLAVVVGQSFSIIYEKFDRIDDKFDKIDEKFKKIDERFNGIDKKLDGMDSRIIGANNRLDHMATNYTRWDEHIKLEKRVEKLELSPA